MNKKRALSILMAAAMAAGTLVTSVPVYADDVEEITWMFWDDLEATEDLISKGYEVIDRFNEEYDGKYHVTPITTNLEEYDGKLNALIAAGQTPDVYICNPGPNMDVYVNAGAAADLTDILENQEADWYASFTDGIFERMTYDGKIMAVPTNFAAACVYYNTEMFADAGVEVPTTYDELIAACQKLQDAGTLNDIESDFQSIRDAENYLTIQQQTGGELNQSRRDQIKQNMQLISETLKKNKEQISQLEEKLKKSGIQSSALRKTIDRLSSELDQKATMIVALQEDLAKKNVRIQELDEMVSSLNEDVESLATTAAAQSEKLNAQDKALHTAYYCFGTSKELKEQKILSGGGLFSKSKVLQSGFNKDYFISIDIREVKEIPLFASKAKLKSNHPEGSYEFVEDEDGNLTLKINDEKAFWSLGKYLVIEVG